MGVNLKSLIGKLNQTTRAALEGAAGLCLTRTHFNIEIEHYLLKLLDSPNNDLARILHRCGIEGGRLQQELMRSLDRMRTGNGRTPTFSLPVTTMLTEAWTIGSVEYGATQIRSGLTLLALLSNEDLLRLVREFSQELEKIQVEVLRREFQSVIAGSVEDPASAQEPAAPAKGSKTPYLDQYTINLTENAKQGKIDPVLGRDREIRQVIDILMRRRQNNPILTGEAGVGKTAIVEGFAVRVGCGDVPPPLRNVAIRTLDLALLQAGAGVKGEFENRVKGLIDEVKASPSPIILFIDEAHNLIGAGGQAGQNDAANLLKPALARGELRTIAAATWSEYKKYFERDAALARRFQVVKVEEPSEDACMLMLRGLVPSLERHHNVRILDEGVAAAVRLTHRYLAGRYLPDKAVSILDTACARVALGQNSVPPVIEETFRTLRDLEVQERVLERESAVGADHAERLVELARLKEQTNKRLGELRRRFDAESKLVAQIRGMRAKIEQAPAGPSRQQESATSRQQLDAAVADLSTLQAGSPLIRVCVDSEIVREVLSAWTGIPVGKLLRDEVSAMLSIEQQLARRIIGQDHALKAIAQRIQISRANLEDPGKPVAVFLLVGPSGVGKTETALVLSDLLYGGERNLISFNMSEFHESHTASTLKGSPPGYVGYGEGGALTEAVRRRPYSVVLLDEVEKAHPDVLKLFLQVCDKGIMEDAEGREIDFRNTIIILTSNAGGETIMKLCANPRVLPPPEGLTAAIRPELNRLFRPTFLGRLTVVPYYPVRDSVLRSIVKLKLERIAVRLEENHSIKLTWDERLVGAIAKRCTEVESGARNVDSILTHTLLPDISRQILVRMAEGGSLKSIRIALAADGSFYYA
jgi:type VI secretion system protein VasG